MAQTGDGGDKFTGYMEYEVKNITNADSPYTPGNEKTIEVDTSSGDVVIDLITAVEIQGRTYNIYCNGSGSVTTDGNGTETIDDELTQVITDKECITIQSNNTNWIIV